jgi:hypothetical protein
VKLFVADEYAGDIMSDHYKIFPTEIIGEKRRVREYLEEKVGKDADRDKEGMKWTALNGGPFFDMC